MISRRQKRKIKGFLKRDGVKLALAGVASALLISMALQGCHGVSSNVHSNTDNLVDDTVSITQTGDAKVFEYEKKLLEEHQAEVVENDKYDCLNFEVMDFAGKTYLTLNKADMLTLIKQAMLEVDDEYINNGATSVFSSTDAVYSRFTPEHIYGLMSTETDFRLLEIKDENKSIYKVSNYKSFKGKSEGIVYHGLGMVSEATLKDIVERDRRDVNHFEDYSSIEIDGERTELNFANLDAYSYILNSGAKTESEIKDALAENIMLNAKCIYMYLNRIVKDYVKEGKHDAELDKLGSYKKLAKMSEEDKQIFFALLAYNQGPSITINSMLNGTLFEKNKEGEYINNIKYPLRAMERAEQAKIEQGAILQQ